VDEIVVVLDKCSDCSPKIAEKHASEDPRVKVLTLDKHKFKTQYMAETVNVGISEAKSDVTGFVDADTMLGPNYISQLLPYLKKPVVSVAGRLIFTSKRFLHFRETIGGTGRLFFRELWEEVGGLQDVEACDTFFDLEILKRGYEFKVIEKAVMYDIRKYSMRKLTGQAIRRGKGRRQLSQSFFFMIGHGLYYLTRTPFGFVELLANIIGYLTTDRKASRAGMKLYEAKRIREIIQKLRTRTSQ
jgi:glycosyltransferase involved in cell wall biosynthesis